MVESRCVIALTGSMGSGKSTVAGFFSDEGASIIDADDLARAAVLPGSPPIESLRRKFGDIILLPDGSLNRRKLAEIIFNDASLRRTAEEIIHPEVFRLFDTRLSRLPPQAFIVCVVPLLFESGMDLHSFRKIVVVTASEETLIRRIMNRDRCSEADAKKRLSAQLPSAEKERRADFVITNDGDLESLRNQVSTVFRSIMSCR